jgi:hypothetical protein
VSTDNKTLAVTTVVEFTYLSSVTQPRPIFRRGGSLTVERCRMGTKSEVRLAELYAILLHLLTACEVAHSGHALNSKLI